MRKLFVVFLIGCFLCGQVAAQDLHFIYIQSENQKPFYVRLNNKVYKASGDGYLLIPGLINSSHRLSIGTEGSNNAEWRFDCEISNQDLAFTLKTSSAGFELIPMGESRKIAGTKETAKTEKKTKIEGAVISGPMSDDAFSEMLAGVVNDPSIRERTALIQKEAPMAAQTSAAIAPDFSGQKVTTTSNTTASLVTQETQETEVAASVPVNQSPVVKEAPTTTTKVADQAFVVKEKVADKNNKEKKEDNLPPVTQTATAANGNKTEGGKETTAKTTDRALVQALEDGFKIKETKDADKKQLNDKAITAKNDNPALTDTPAVVNAQKNENRTSSVESFVIKETRDADKQSASKTAAAETPKNDPPVNTTATVNRPDTAFVIKEQKDANKSQTTKTVTDNTQPFVIKEVTNVASRSEKDVQKKLVTGTKADSTPQSFVIKETRGNEAKNNVASKPAIAVSSVIKKTLQRRSADGIELIYVDEYADGTKDTIRILIPAEKP